MREARRHLTLQLFFRNSLTLTAALGTASALALSAAAFAASNEATNETSNSMSGNSAAGPSAQNLMNSQKRRLELDPAGRRLQRQSAGEGKGDRPIELRPDAGRLDLQHPPKRRDRISSRSFRTYDASHPIGTTSTPSTRRPAN